jgi:hypothetical protein
VNAPARPDRRALRRDPETLATIVVGQLTAYNCSTIYAPSATRLDAFVRDMVLPRLHAQLDARAVIVERWDPQHGPTVKQLAGELCRQLEMEPTDEPPAAALESALRRAERRSDRPLVIVLYRLELLLDDGRDPAEVARFVDALNRIASRPTHGLHLVLGVREEDLGGFRELLRGRWRLLANDVRIRPNDARWIVPVPLFATFVASPAAVLTAIVAALAAGLVAGSFLAAPREPPPPPECVCNETPAPAPVVAPPPPVTPPESTGDVTTTTGAGTTADVSASTSDVDATTDVAATTAVDTKPASKPPPPVAAKSVCGASPNDTPCAACVRSKCCAALQACKKTKWRNCVLKGPLGEEPCTPDAVEDACRDLALCALENECRPTCFNQ